MSIPTELEVLHVTCSKKGCKAEGAGYWKDLHAKGWDVHVVVAVRGRKPGERDFLCASCAQTEAHVDDTEVENIKVEIEKEN